MILTTLLLWSCPFDEAGVEVTILAHKTIYNAAKSGDFDKTYKAIEKEKKLYEYFEKADKKPLYLPLLKAAEEKNEAKVKSLLDYSLELEIKELLGEVEKNFSKYQKSRLLLIKAKKHLKALTKNKKAMKYMKNILKSIGNPGLMGVGKREPDKELFIENKKLLLESTTLYVYNAPHN